MVIGLLMVCDEDDILDATLKRHCEIADAIYTLDGGGGLPTWFAMSDKFGCYFKDSDLSRPPYSHQPKDGHRQVLYERAVRDHGHDNLFLLLHGDEVWTFDPAAVADEYQDVDGFCFRLPFYFPHADEGWDERRHPLEQLHWRLGPGWPEFRMFRGNPEVRYDINQHFNVVPSGLRKIHTLPLEIRHYPFRAPSHQIERAARHELTGFDPENYRHILNEGRTLWDDDLISRWQGIDHFAEVSS